MKYQILLLYQTPFITIENETLLQIKSLFTKHQLQFNYIPRKLFKSIYKNKEHQLIKEELFNPLSDSYYVSIAQPYDITLSQENLLPMIRSVHEKVKQIQSQIQKVGTEFYFVGYLIDQMLFNETQLNTIVEFYKKEEERNGWIPQFAMRQAQTSIHAFQYQMIDSIIQTQQQINFFTSSMILPTLTNKIYI